MPETIKSPSLLVSLVREAINHMQMTEDNAAAIEELRASVSALALQMAEIEPQLASLRDRMTAVEARLDAIETPAEPEPQPAPEPEPTPEPVTSKLNVLITFADLSTADANFETAEDWGDYTAPAPYSFTQHNRVAALPAPDGQTLYVHFRPDADGTRQEVVFENGMLSKTPAYIRPYRVVIRDGDTVLADIDLATEWAGKTQGANANNQVSIKHWSYARWRWQSAPRPVVRQPAELIAAGLLPPYDPAYISREYGDGGTVSYNHPMDHAGIMMAMGASGERSDIGLMTEHQAEYIFKPDDPRTLGNVMAQAEGAASIPWHVRDPNTHAPIDFYRPEHAGTNTHPNNPSHPGSNSPWGMDQSHQPALNYLPYLLTGDPYYLEGLQGQMTYNTLWTRFQRFRDGHMVINDSQVRGYAWAMRTLMQLARVTPDNVPSWLLPRLYYEDYLADNMAWFTDTYSGPNATYPLKHFGVIGELQGAGGTHTSPWMQYMLAAVLGWGVLMGHENMAEAFEYSLGYAINMFNGESGWPRQMGGAYHQFFRRSNTEPWAQTWAKAWAITREMEDPKPGFDFSQEKPLFRDGGAYEAYARGALGMGVALGIEEARGPWQYLHEQIQANLKSTGPIWKYAFGPKLQG